MARLRSYLLPALVIGALAMWAGTIDSARLFDTYGMFFDRASDTNNIITADSLGAPSSLVATANGVTTIDLSWTSSSDLYATHYEIFRCNPGPCTPSSQISGSPFAEGTLGATCSNASQPCAYSNTGLTGSTQYCYKVRTTYLNWTSAFSNTSCATTATPVTLNDLYLKSVGQNLNTDCDLTTNSLVNPASASSGCTLSANVAAPFEFGVWVSATVTVTGQADWILTLDLDTGPPFQNARLTAELWLATNVACGDSSAGAGKTLLAATAGSTTLLADGTLTLAPAAITPTLTGKLCLKITNQGGNDNNGTSHAARILTSGASKLRGPFDP